MNRVFAVFFCMKYEVKETKQIETFSCVDSSCVRSLSSFLFISTNFYYSTLFVHKE